MASFRSEARHLVLQDEGGVWAWFEDHVFETGVKKVADRLRATEGVTEVKTEAPAPAKAEKN